MPHGASWDHSMPLQRGVYDTWGLSPAALTESVGHGSQGQKTVWLSPVKFRNLSSLQLLGVSYEGLSEGRAGTHSHPRSHAEQDF